MTFTERPDYDEEVCWQYDIRVRNRAEDLEAAGLTEADVAKLHTSDFEFRPIENQAEKRDAIDFIKRHEWLGNIGKWPTEYFGAWYDGKLAGVVIFSVPGHQSEQDTHRLIARGACISWSPKNLASAFLSWCMKWMVANTPYRIFTAYSDPDARELGSIYQALNFYYLGTGNGVPYKYENPYKPGQLVTDRFFRIWRTYRRYAAELGIEWQSEWHHEHGMYWDKVPDEIEAQLRAQGIKTIHATKRVPVVKKHKYAFVLGANKTETRRLRREFEVTHKILPYPKNRGE